MPYTPTTWQDNQAPDINAANLNNLETGVSKAPYGLDASANFVPVWNGSAWTYSGVKNAHVDAAAAIAYSKLALTGSILNADISGSAAIAYAKLNLAASILNADVATGAAIAVSKLAAGSNGQVLTTTGGVPAWGAAGGVTTYRKNTSKTVNTTVAETDLLNAEITVAANAISSTGVLQLLAWGDWLNNTGGGLAYPRFKLKLGGTTLFDTGALNNGGVAMGASASRYGWRLAAEIVNLSATNSQLASMLLGGSCSSDRGAAAAFTTGEGSYTAYLGAGSNAHVDANGFTTSAVDTTASQALVFSVINASASASYETKLYGAFVVIQ